MSVCYIDTSALAKWYLQEAGSQAFEVFANTIRVRLISRLTTVELRCLLARRRRANEIDEDYEADAWSTFTTHVAAGVFRIEPVPDSRLNEARELIENLCKIPLRTLDAIHLAAAQAAQATLLATADDAQRRAADMLGLEVAYFGSTLGAG